METPDLIIPIRMEASKATAALAKVGADGKKAGDDVEAGTKTAQGGLRGAVQAASDFGRKAVAIHGVQLAMSAVGAAASAMSTEFKNAVDYITNIAKEFVELRQAMQQVAALRGTPNTNEFTVKESEKAFEASLTPQEWRSFQEQFQSYDGAYLEGDQARFVDREINGKKVTGTEQGEQYQQKIAEFAKACGIPAAKIVQFGGALLQFSEVPQDVETLMSQLGKVYRTLERAPTPVAELMTAMSRVMAQGASPEEASQMLAIMSEAMPHEEETGVINALKAITNETLEGRGAALGQQEDMTPLKKIKVAVQSIKDRVDKGEKLDAIVHGIAPDLREAKGIKGFLTRGLEAKGFERTEGYQQQTPEDFVDQAIAEYEQSDAGHHAKAVARRSLAESRAGARHADLETLKEEATARMTERGEFEEMHLGESLIRGATGKLTGVDTRQQRINAEMLADVGGRTAAAGIETDINPNTAYGRAEIAMERATQDQLTINTRIAELLEKIEENTKKENDAAEKPTAEPGKPLSAKPPSGAGARQ